MNLRKVKSQTEKGIPSSLHDMMLFTYKGNSVFSDKAIDNLRQHLLFVGGTEGKDFVFYNNRLYFPKGGNFSSYVAKLPAVNGSPDSYNSDEVTGHIKMAPVDSIESTNKNNIESVVWEWIDIPGGINRIPGLLNLIVKTLNNLGFSDKDFQLVGSMIFVNTDSNQKASSFGGATFVGKSVEECVFQILETKEVISNRNEVLKKMLPNDKYVTEDYWAAYPFPVNKKDEASINKYREKIEEWIKTTDFSKGKDYYIMPDGSNVELNIYSPRYEELLEAIYSFDKRNGYFSSFPMPTEKNQSSLKDWVEIKLISNSEGGVRDYDMSQYLHSLSFIPGDDYVIDGDSPFINARSSRSDVIYNIIYRLARDKRFGLENFETVKAESVSSINFDKFWGADVPERFNSEDYQSSETEALFKIDKSVPSDNGSLYLIKHYTQKCIEELISNGITDFFGTISGEVYYPLSQLNEFEDICSKYDSALPNDLSRLKSAISLGNEDALMKSILKDDFEEYKKTKDSNLRNSIERLWKYTESPISFLKKPSESKLKYLVNLVESNYGSKFYNMTEKQKLANLRRLISESGIYPGYDFFAAFSLKSLDTLEFTGIEDLASRRKINLGHEYEKHVDELYEYLSSANNFDFLRVNSFIHEYCYNTTHPITKKGIDIDGIHYRIGQAILSIFYSALSAMRSQTIFSPIPGDVAETKKRYRMFEDLVGKFDTETLLNDTKEMAKVLFDGKESDYNNLPTVVSIKTSPYYKYIIQTIHVYISDKLKEVVSSYIQGE